MEDLHRALALVSEYAVHQHACQERDQRETATGKQGETSVNIQEFYIVSLLKE